MKKLLIVFILSLLSSDSVAQEEIHHTVSQSEIGSLIEQITDSLQYYYVDEKHGIRIGEELNKRFTDGNYKDINNPVSLAQTLTDEMRSIADDLHLSLNYTAEEPASSPDLYPQYGSYTNYGFEDIKFLDNNVAYLKISHFSSWEFANQARQNISDIMPLFGNSRALIIDVRDNPGGVPYIVSYLVSYFFEREFVELAEYYVRHNDYSYSIYTEPYVPGNTYPDLPLYILTSKKSGSAAEELAFWMQNQKRATLIGEPTAGAGYGASIHQLEGPFSIYISSSVERDPITKMGFQNAGVQPDISVPADSAMNIALEMAKGNDYEPISWLDRQNSYNRNKLDSLLSQPETPEYSERINNLVVAGIRSTQLSFSQVNQLGYDYLDEPLKAMAILKANVECFPFYPNSFDSYGDALVAAERYKEARNNYNKAVTMATIKNHPSLSVFIQNRDNFEAQFGDSID